VIYLIKNNIPINEKFNLTVVEASEYFNIGRDKLYELAKEDGCKFVIHNGRSVLIKRKVLEKYLEQITYI
jgi:excisionase family DNA binding protein